MKFEALDARASKELVAVGETWDYPAWAIAEWNALTLQENAAYEKVCAEWWASSGPFHGFLKRYRDHLVQAIPQRETAERVGAGFMVQLVDTPTEPFQPTAKLRAVDQYIDEVSLVFAKRRREPSKPRTAME